MYTYKHEQEVGVSECICYSVFCEVLLICLTIHLTYKHIANKSQWAVDSLQKCMKISFHLTFCIVCTTSLDTSNYTDNFVICSPFFARTMSG